MSEDVKMNSVEDTKGFGFTELNDDELKATKVKLFQERKKLPIIRGIFLSFYFVI